MVKIFRISSISCRLLMYRCVWNQELSFINYCGEEYSMMYSYFSSVQYASDLFLLFSSLSQWFSTLNVELLNGAIRQMSSIWIIIRSLISSWRRKQNTLPRITDRTLKEPSHRMRAREESIFTNEHS